MAKKHNPLTMTRASDILEQIVAPKKGGFSPEHARFVLSLKFAPSLRAEYLSLSEKAQLGTLRPAEQYQLDKLLDANSMLVILKSKARVSLRKHELDV
jgi:hypothetical protein